MGNFGQVVKEWRVKVEQRVAIAVRKVGSPAWIDDTASQQRVIFDVSNQVQRSIGGRGDAGRKQRVDRQQRGEHRQNDPEAAEAARERHQWDTLSAARLTGPRSYQSIAALAAGRRSRNLCMLG